MRRRALIRYLTKQGCEKLREDGNHTVWWNSANRRTSTVARHAEVIDQLVWKICKDLGISKP